jgi:predicted transcriptional regulator
VRRRGHGEIVIDILEAALKPQKKMRIMYGANLNFERFNRYFYELLRKGLIEEASDPDEKQLYKISDRGKTLLLTLKTGRDMLYSDEH